jgi:transmembrane sensor
MNDKDRQMADGTGTVQERAAAWFARLRADNVTERERASFQDWVLSDPGNRVAYERMESIWSEFGRHADKPEVFEALSMAYMATRRRATAVRRNPWRAMIGPAVAALVVLALGYMGWHAQPVERKTYATGVGEQRTIVLQDGSRVTLDTDTRLTTAFSPDARQLTLEHGRAFFHVAKDKRRPFLMNADGGVIRAVGTQFDVFEHDDLVEVTLIEGKVIVSPSDASSHATATPMEAGQRLLMGRMYSHPVVSPAETGAAEWLSGKLVFNDTPLPDAIAQFNRYNTGKIRIGDQATAGMHVSGVFRSSDTDAFLDALHVSYGVSVRKGLVETVVVMTE